MTQLITFIELAVRAVRYSSAVRTDMVNVHTLALLPIGVAIKIWTGATLVYDAHELETEIDGLTGFRQILARIVEGMCIPFVDLGVFVSPPIELHYKGRYPSLPTVTVMNCPRTADPQVGELRDLRSELELADGATLYLHLGGLCVGRGIETIVEAFKNADAQERVVAFLGFGELEGLIQDAAAHSPSIRLLPPVKPDDVVGIASSADVGVTLTYDTCLNHRFCLPNKLFEYWMAGLPVIVSNLPEMSRVVSETGAGVVASVNSAEGLISAMEQVESGPLGHLRKQARLASSTYQWDNEATKLIEALRSCLLLK